MSFSFTVKLSFIFNKRRAEGRRSRGCCSMVIGGEKYAIEGQWKISMYSIKKDFEVRSEFKIETSGGQEI